MDVHPNDDMARKESKMEEMDRSEEDSTEKENDVPIVQSEFGPTDLKCTDLDK